jgi:phosphatidate phosphatase PAH1
MLNHCHSYDILVVKQPNGTLSASQALVYFGHTLRTEIDPACFELSLVLVRDAKALCYPFNKDKRFDDETLRNVVTNLQPGRNGARVLLVDGGGNNNEILGIAPMNVYFWMANDPVAVVDVDGTITRSTLSGFWKTAIQLDFSGRHCHSAVCPFVQTLAETTMNILYLTNRPITYASKTRDFLATVQQQETSLPEGLLVGFMGTLAGVFEV